MTLVLAKVMAIIRQAAEGKAVEQTASLLGPKRILAVDDSQTYLHELSDALRVEGYDMVAAHSGDEALELLAVQPADCILLDLRMPGLSGIETCRRIKSAPVVRDIPLIILTASEDRESMVQGLGVGADDYIQKSGSFDILKARVRAQIRRKQFEDENRFIREQRCCAGSWKRSRPGPPISWPRRGPPWSRSSSARTRSSRRSATPSRMTCGRHCAASMASA